MGWWGAGEIFGPVCEELQKSHLWPATRKKILVVLIKALRDGDWDTEYASLEEFADDEVVVAAFREACPEMFEPEEEIENLRPVKLVPVNEEEDEIDFGGREVEHSDFYGEG